MSNRHRSHVTRNSNESCEIALLFLSPTLRPPLRFNTVRVSTISGEENRLGVFRNLSLMTRDINYHDIIEFVFVDRLTKQSYLRFIKERKKKAKKVQTPEEENEIPIDTQQTNPQPTTERIIVIDRVRFQE